MKATDIEALIAAIDRGAGEGPGKTLVASDPSRTGKNAFLFFIKPELLLSGTNLQRPAILTMILEKVAAVGLHIRTLHVLSAAYLAKHGLIAQHYGVINRIASDASGAMSDGAKSKFEALFGKSVEAATVLGGLEFLEEFPQFTAFTLDMLWQNGACHKLAGGTYAVQVTIDGETVYLVNGFHPRQLEHFTADGRCIVVASLVGDLDWSQARNALIGKTNPADAAPGSIRRTLLEEADNYGLTAVNSSWNGVHLSAGPIEGLVELIRYESNHDAGETLSAADFSFGRRVLEVFGPGQTAFFLRNPDVVTSSGHLSVFDLTEELNADEAIERLRELKA